MSNRINRLHKRGLRALLNDEISTIKDMLSQSNDTKTHVKKIQTLMTEFYKYLYGFSAPMIQEVFTKISLTLFRMGFFGAAHGWWGGGGKKARLLKICHAYPTIVKPGIVIPYLKKIQKVYESRDTPLRFY